MSRKIDEAGLRDRDIKRQRVRFLLDFRWAGNQRQMARDLGVAQSLVSKIVNGAQGAGKRFLATLARYPGVNPDWLVRGEGQPLLLPPKGTLPVSYSVLPGSPIDYPNLLSGERHPIAESLDRPTRYWLELPPHSPLLRDPALRLMDGDLVLIESDRAWIGRVDLVESRICAVRLQVGQTEPVPYLGKLFRDAQGFMFDAIDFATQLLLARMQASPVSPPAPPVDEAQRREDFYVSFGRVKRILRMDVARDLLSEDKLEVPDGAEMEISKPSSQAKADQSSSQGQADQPRSQKVRAVPTGARNDTITYGEIVGVCVYMVRPSPRIVREQPAANAC
jgi:hypothetical protein